MRVRLRVHTLIRACFLFECEIWNEGEYKCFSIAKIKYGNVYIYTFLFLFHCNRFVAHSPSFGCCYSIIDDGNRRSNKLENERISFFYSWLSFDWYVLNWNESKIKWITFVIQAIRAQNHIELISWRKQTRS